jgi:hypothetical protein
MYLYANPLGANPLARLVKLRCHNQEFPMELQSTLATRLLEPHDLASPVLIEIVNNLTFAEFYEIYAKAKPDAIVALDNSDLVESLLAGNDDGKKLVVASFSGGGHFREGIKAETAITLANVSRAHKIALLSNVRLDWYGILLFKHKEAVRTELLAATILCGEHDEKRALLRNPRMDRRFVESDEPPLSGPGGMLV